MKRNIFVHFIHLSLYLLKKFKTKNSSVLSKAKDQILLFTFIDYRHFSTFLSLNWLLYFIFNIVIVFSFLCFFPPMNLFILSRYCSFIFPLIFIISFQCFGNAARALMPVKLFEVKNWTRLRKAFLSLFNLSRSSDGADIQSEVGEIPRGRGLKNFTSKRNLWSVGGASHGRFWDSVLRLHALVEVKEAERVLYSALYFPF